MGIAATLEKAERSILKSFGIAAVFTTYDGQTYELTVAPEGELNTAEADDFRANLKNRRYSCLASDIPGSWRDSTLTVGGRTFNVIDVDIDDYNVSALLRVE
ncbi:MAG: hypothetical protein CMK92_05240 [Pseudomonas sp.]|nr:hypothetical protein [Pseudomonas sp.]